MHVRVYIPIHLLQAHNTIPQTGSLTAVTIHWTGLLDWNTGLDYWTELFSLFGQVSVFILGKKLTFLQSTSSWVLRMIVIMNSCSVILFLWDRAPKDQHRR